MSGQFFVFDGMDGAGKSTAIAGLKARLEADQHEICCTREPGGSPLAEEIRRCMLRDWEQGMPMETELLLVFAARCAHLEQTVIPALQAGKLVLCDRFVDSSFVYQGELGGADQEWIESLAQRTIQQWPTQTFIFDLPVETAVQRMQQRGLENRFDREANERLELTRAAFRQRVEKHPDTHQLVPALGAPDEVAHDLYQRIRRYL